MSEPGPLAPGRFRGAIAVWLILIAYASLYPFFPPRLPSGEAILAMFARPRYLVAYDIVWNVLAYMPLGVLLRVHFSRIGARHPNIIAVKLAAGWSFLMEALQLFLPNRVASMYDVASNAAGAALGVAMFFEPFHSTVTRPLAEEREHWLIPGARGDAG